MKKILFFDFDGTIIHSVKFTNIRDYIKKLIKAKPLSIVASLTNVSIPCLQL